MAPDFYQCLNWVYLIICEKDISTYSSKNLIKTLSNLILRVAQYKLKFKSHPLNNRVDTLNFNNRAGIYSNPNDFNK